MNIQDVGWTDASSIDEKMRVAALMPVPVESAPPDYCSLRDEYRKRHKYGVSVDENLLVVDCGKSAYSDDGVDVVIPLPFVRGVSSIYECYTAGRGSAVNLLVFSITVDGWKDKVIIYQDEPFSWWGAPQDKIAVLRNQEMKWHKKQLAVQRHEVLSAINEYINRVLQMSPENRQLKLGF